MILALKTDSSEATVILIAENGSIVDEYSWVAHRSLARDLLKVIHDRLVRQDADWKDLTGLVLFKGPGSFTGLRIGAAVANAIAHSERIPIVGVTGDKWLAAGLKGLKNGVNDRIVLPEYGAAANITKQKK